MPSFFLHHVVDGVRVEDEEGHDLPDLETAMREAVLGIRAVQGDRLLAGLPLQEGQVEITDLAGRRLASVSYNEAVRECPDLDAVDSTRSGRVSRR